MTVIFCPGFMGLPEDFKQLTAGLDTENIICLDYFSSHAEDPCSVDMGRWARGVLEKVNGPFVAIGYSMGARMALHLWFHAKSRCQGLFLMSCNPGFTVEDLVRRRQNDHDWSDRFLTDDWSNLTQAWNSQPVLNSGKEPARPEESFSRNALSWALQNWSFYQHDFKIHDLEDLPAKTVWCFGQKDSKYLQIADLISNQGLPGQVLKIPHSGHRVLLDNSISVSNHFSEFIEDFV